MDPESELGLHCLTKRLLTHFNKGKKQTSLRVRLVLLKISLSPPVFFSGHSKVVLLLWILFVIYVSCLSLLCCLVCFLQLGDCLLGKG